MATRKIIGQKVPIEVEYGGTGASTFTSNGVLTGSGTTAITATAAATTGQTLMGNTGAAPSFTDSPEFAGSVTAGTGLTVADGSITVTDGNIGLTHGSIDLTEGNVVLHSGDVQLNSGDVHLEDGGLTLVEGDINVTDGDVRLDAGSIYLEPTTASGDGTIYVDSARWISNYGTSNVFMGKNAGNTTLTLADALYNIGIGENALTAATIASRNVAVGYGALSSATSGDRNVAIGMNAATNLTEGTNSTLIGPYVASTTTTGANNIIIGYIAGQSLGSTDSSNILLGSFGVSGDDNTIRIGEQGTGTSQQNKAFMAGIYNTTQSGGVDQVVTIDSNGQLGADDELVMANQPAFLAYLGTTVNNVTGDNEYWQLGTTTALTEVFDQGSDFNTNGVFTAPVTGKYQFFGAINLSGISSASNGKIRLVTSNRSFDSNILKPSAVKSQYDAVTFQISILTDMDAGDTAYIQIQTGGEGATVNDVTGGGPPYYSYFSGYLAF